MFKFLKSKKGFTLVELMIVVVIMAILVAVAVPIYNAVTENSRKKTCLGNQRTIVGQINTSVMADPSVIAIADNSSAEITIKTNATGDGIAENGVIDEGVFDTTGDTFKSFFNEKNLPYCPEDNNTLEITVSTSDVNGYVGIDVVCSNTTHKAN